MKTNKTMMIVASAGGLLALAAAVLLVREVQAFRKAERDLKDSERALQAFYRQDPFPSKENVAAERENLATAGHWHKTLILELMRGQLRIPQTTPPQFTQMLFEKHAQLMKMAESGGIALTGGDKFAFGFEEYITGVLPPAEEVSRLTDQLMVTDILARMLFEENVRTLAKIGPEKSDGDTRERVRPRGGSPQKTETLPTSKKDTLGALSTKTRYVLEFTAREQPAMRFLNKVAAHGAFMAVTNLEIETLGTDVQSPNVPGPTDATERMKMKLHQHPDRADRVVSGRGLGNLLRIKMALDVYRFKGDGEG